jgi:hypothetical protein
VFDAVIDPQSFQLLAEAERLMLSSQRQQLDALAAIL